MTTRGLFGFYYKGKYYVIYNHCDSYPSGLGYNIVKEIEAEMKQYNNLDRWIKLLTKIKIITEDQKPTQLDIDNLKEYTCLDVGYKRTDDWDCLLYKTNGSVNQVLQSGYMINNVDEDGNPIFYEYAYIINLDSNQFDFYVDDNLIASFKLTALPQFV